MLGEVFRGVSMIPVELKVNLLKKPFCEPCDVFELRLSLYSVQLYSVYVNFVGETP